MIYPWNKILITGGYGSLGKELQQILPDCIYISSKDFDLTKDEDVKQMFERHKPYLVIHLASKVGSLLYNLKNQTHILEDNLIMNALIVKYSNQYNSRLIAILSTCIYAEYLDEIYRPMREEIVFDGKVPETNAGYALSKRILGQSIDLYNKHHDKNWSYLIPCNLFSEYDEFNLEKSHFINALVKKIHLAVHSGSDYIELIGNGLPKRQFIDSSDLAKIIKLYLEKDYIHSMNIVGDNLSIKEMAEKALKSLNLENKIKIKFDMDISKNGQIRKDASDIRFKQYFPEFKFQTFEDGITKLYKKLESSTVI